MTRIPFDSRRNEGVKSLFLTLCKWDNQLVLKYFSASWSPQRALISMKCCLGARLSLLRYSLLFLLPANHKKSRNLFSGLRIFNVSGAEGRTQKVAPNYLKLLDSCCRKLYVFCRILQPIRNQFPWFARLTLKGQHIHCTPWPFRNNSWVNMYSSYRKSAVNNMVCMFNFLAGVES